jgi:tetratricopeptide (TPR) repeat protein
MALMTLESRGSRWALVAALLAAGGWFTWYAAQFAWSQEQLESEDLAKVEQAIVLRPEDARLHDHAGLLYLYRASRIDEAAVREFRTATGLNPRVASFWADLARACFISGDDECVRKASATAIEEAPMVPRYRREAAMFLLALGDQHEAIQQLSRYFELDPSGGSIIIPTLLNTFASPQSVWDKLLKQQSNSDLVLAFIYTLLKRGDFVDASSYWHEAVVGGVRFHSSQVQSFLYSLKQQKRFADIAAVWTDLQHMGSVPPNQLGNIVYNGDFTHEIQNCGFDWVIGDYPFVHASVEAIEGSDGRALHIAFTVPRNDDITPVRHLIALEPETPYELSAFIRAQDLASDSGPRLRVTDAECDSCLDVTTESTIGTTSWHGQKLRFTTGPRTEFAWISVWRPRSRRFPSQITGDFWMTEVSLRAVAPLYKTTER